MKICISFIVTQVPLDFNLEFAIKVRSLNLKVTLLGVSPSFLIIGY